MKRFCKIFLSAVVFLALGCQEDGLRPDEGQQAADRIYTATIEQGTQTKLAVGEDAVTLRWTAGDKITVIGRDINQAIVSETVELTVNSDGSSALFSMAVVCNPIYAVFGATPLFDSTTGELTGVTLPSSYGTPEAPYNGAVTAPMFADMTDYIKGPVHFRHLAGVMRIDIGEVPAGITGFSFTAGRRIIGSFSLGWDDWGEPSIFADGTGGYSVSYTIAASEAERPMTFYVPLPLAVYEGFTAELTGYDGSSSVFAAGGDYEITRRKLALMPQAHDPDFKTAFTADKATYTVYTDKGLMKVRELLTRLPSGVTECVLEFGPNSTIDMNSHSDWEPIALSANTFTINGQGSTIKGLKKSLVSATFGNRLTINSLTISDSKMLPMAAQSNDLGIGTFVMNTEGQNKILSFYDCHAKNITIDEDDLLYVGGIIGYSGVADTFFKECSVEDCIFSAVGVPAVGCAVAGLAGLVNANLTVEDCLIKNCTLNSGNDYFYQVGVVAGVLNNPNAVTTVTSITEYGNTVRQDDAFTGNHNDDYNWGVVWGRQPDGTLNSNLYGVVFGSFVLDGMDLVRNGALAI